MINIYDDMNNLVSNFNKLEEVTEFKKILEDLKKEENEQVEDDLEKTQTKRLNLKDIDKKLNENVNEEINLYDFRDKMNQNDLIIL